jgi:hypothetical protein
MHLTGINNQILIFGCCIHFTVPWFDNYFSSTISKQDLLNFIIYPHTTNAEIIPAIYHHLLPDLMPDYDKVLDPKLYQTILDRVLYHINKSA